MIPVLGAAAIGAIGNALGGASQARQARADREVQERQWAKELKEKQYQFRASLGSDLAQRATGAAGDHYTTQVSDDERTYQRQNSNNILPMKQDILNSLYARVGGNPMGGGAPGMRPEFQERPSGDMGAVMAPGGPGRQIDFSQQAPVVPQADRSGYDAAVARQQEQAVAPNAGMPEVSKVMTSADRKAALNDAKRQAVQAAVQQAQAGGKMGAMDMVKIAKQAAAQAEQAFYAQHGR